MVQYFVFSKFFHRLIHILLVGTTAQRLVLHVRHLMEIEAYEVGIMEGERIHAVHCK
jgi:hypothetical protein